MESLILSPQFCVLLSLLLAYIPHWYRTFGVVRPSLARAGKTYNVKYSRKMVEATSDETTVEGRLIIRLTNCHQNGLEAFTAFGISVSLALASGVSSVVVAPTATLFVVLRVIYTLVFIVENLNGPLRSVVWLFSFLVIVRILAFSLPISYTLIS